MNEPSVPEPLRADHELKCWPGPFEAMMSGAKTAEFRKDDRDFKVGETLLLNEWCADVGFTGRCLLRRITHILRGEFGVPKGFAMLSLAAQQRAETPPEPLTPKIHRYIDGANQAQTGWIASEDGLSQRLAAPHAAVPMMPNATTVKLATPPERAETPQASPLCELCDAPGLRRLVLADFAGMVCTACMAEQVTPQASPEPSGMIPDPDNPGHVMYEVSREDLERMGHLSAQAKVSPQPSPSNRRTGQ